MKRRFVTILVLVALVLSVNVLGVTPTHAAATLVARWTLDNTYNDSVGSAHATAYNDPIFFSDPKAEGSHSLELYPSSQYVVLPYTLPGEYTISLWVKPYSYSSRNILAYTSSAGPTTNWSSQIRITANGQAEHFLWDGAAKRVTGITPLLVGWNFLTISAKNNGQMKLYINGDLDGAPVNIGTFWGSGDRFYLGSPSGDGMDGYNGLVDDVRIYNSQMSDAEVQALYSSYVSAVTHYVKQDGVGECTSWADACDLQFAIEKSLPGDQIWVAMGTHKPISILPDPRYATFQLQNRVAVYGGFPDSGDPGFGARNPTTYPTILSGDIGIVGNPADNAYHVVVGAPNATLDGFTITGGNANGGVEPDSFGGGMYNNRGNPALMRIIFSGNSAGSGGGMYNNQGSPTLTNVTFNGNTAGTYHGGGMYSSGGSPIFTDVTFSNNLAPNGHGGGLRNNVSNATLTNVTFSGNTATWGGGVDNYQGTVSFTNVVFNSNGATVSGGGMHNEQSSPTLRSVTFRGNSATWGGGMNNYTNSNAAVTNVTFFNNHASDNGGGMNNDASSPTLTNTTFRGNTAGINTAGGIYNYSGSNPQIRNTILWGDTPQEIVNNSGVPTVSYSVVQNGYSGTGNISADPKLGTLGNYGGATETIPLLPGSSAINTGDDTACDDNPGPNNLDQRGVARPQGVHCDIGAYEYDGYFGVFYAKPGGTGNCQSWANTCTLQTALDNAAYGDEIWVAKGVHKPTTDGNQRFTFQLKNGVAVYGGFDGVDDGFADRDLVANITILSGDLDNNDDYGNEDGNYINERYADITGNNAYHVVSGANGATLDGFVITGGCANYSSGGFYFLQGGGMYNYYVSTLTLRNRAVPE